MLYSRSGKLLVATGIVNWFLEKRVCTREKGAGLLFFHHISTYQCTPLSCVHTYKIYGLKVFSDFKFKGIERLGRKKESKKNADIEILNEDSGRLHTQKRSEKIKGYFPNLLEFVIYDGSKVYIDSTSGADEDEIATAILGDIMAILLRQRGLYVLHACCLSINGRAFSLVGDSGAGKSTTAYFLARNAWNLLSDDITAIDMKPGGLHVIPGPPRVKLKPEVGTQFVNDFEGKKKVHQRSEKRYVYLERSNEPSVLNKIYVLKRGKKRALRI
ncbi:hypothetical protein [Salinibacter ruber]|uniref:hypothetical protein n=1 Tax=Salinibacter ruber TaxID=146919 RepID=UPI00216705A2|nr:hypothetical protein [Salinibacter ruber]